MGYEKREKEILKKVTQSLEEGVVDLSNELEWRNGAYVNSHVFERIFDNVILRDIEDNLEIAIAPTVDVEEFKRCLQHTASRKLLTEKRHSNKTLTISWLFLVIGLSVLILSAYKVLAEYYVLDQTLSIVSWVFIWGFVEKLCFEVPALKYRRTKLIVIYDADIIKE